MNQYDFIILPAIGFFMGYFANVLFITMLFRPYKKLKLGKLQIPFTPGIFPKHLMKLSRSAGNAIQEALLSSQELQTVLLSPRVKSGIINAALSDAFKKADELTFAEFISYVDAEEYYVRLKENIISYLAERIVLVASDIDFATIFTKDQSKSNTKGVAGLFASMLSPNSFPSLSHSIERRIKDHITRNGVSVLKPLIATEIDRLASQNISETILASGLSQETIQKVLEETYEKLIASHLNNIIHAVDLPEIVENKICSANFAPIETYVRSKLKHELRLFTTIGSVVGMTIGLLSVLL